MRLLHSGDWTIHEFPASHIPDYAILSHTWGHPQDEVLLSDVEQGLARTKAAYTKVHYACAQALKDNLTWIWIDTCCIDKGSSAELSETINSMYKWYASAVICYAYLEDVIDPSSMSQLGASRWFTRGWTLQELIAPANITFFSTRWLKIGTKTSLSMELGGLTGIDFRVLTGEFPFRLMSIARRMSWASERVTERPEDIAYCLMGLFEVNMPLLYGEGEKAFIRLQEEIMKTSDDESLFVWKNSADSNEGYHGLLARRPQCFVDSRNMVPYRDWQPRAPFSLSNRGLRIEVPLIHVDTDKFIAVLNCPTPPVFRGYVGIYLKRLSTSDHQYARIRPAEICHVDMKAPYETIYIRQNIILPQARDLYPMHAIQIRSGTLAVKELRVVSCYPISTTDKSRLPHVHGPSWILSGTPVVFNMTRSAAQFSGMIVLRHKNGKSFLLMLGFMRREWVGFNVKVVSRQARHLTDENLQNLYMESPQFAGQSITVEHTKFKVEAESLGHNGIKYHMIHITIDAASQQLPSVSSVDESTYSCLHLLRYSCIKK